MVALGVFLHALGGFAAGSFYIPFKKVRNWAWESYWLAGGVFSWIIAPWVVALLVVPGLFSVLRQASASSIFWTYFFGVMWGIGGLTFGLSMRYLGMSLGYAIALGFCAAFGTIIPPIFEGKFGDLLTHTSGQTTLAGVLVCLFRLVTLSHPRLLQHTARPTFGKLHLILDLFNCLAFPSRAQQFPRNASSSTALSSESSTTNFLS
jgi:L-rhamnose-H+ transport protein